MLCPIGWRIVRYLAPLPEPVKAAAIAAAVDEAHNAGMASTRLRLLLGNLVERRILLRFGGYTLSPEFHALLRDQGE